MSNEFSFFSILVAPLTWRIALFFSLPISIIYFIRSLAKKKLLWLLLKKTFDYIHYLLFCLGFYCWLVRLINCYLSLKLIIWIKKRWSIGSSFVNIYFFLISFLFLFILLLRLIFVLELKRNLAKTLK